MRKIATVVLVIGIFAVSLFSADLQTSDQEWVSDIQANPSRYWNRTVTVVGDVQAVVADPPGTTRGTYNLRDDSGPNPLTVQTRDLPPVGKRFQVTGVIVQDPNNANVPFLREMRRSRPGLSSNIKILLIAGGALFLILLVVFIILLARPAKTTAPAPTVRPTPPPPSPAPAPAPDKTARVTAPPAQAPASAPSADKTQVYMSLGAEFVVEKGPDKGKQFSLHKQVTLIGRSGARKNDVELKDDTISKEQASIYFDNSSKQFTLKNESQVNVTQVNSKMATDPIVLNSGDLIEMGKTVLKFQKE